MKIRLLLRMNYYKWLNFLIHYSMKIIMKFIANIEIILHITFTYINRFIGRQYFQLALFSC